MNPVWIVCRKEMVETLRDRRTLFSLLLGPLLGPLLFVVLINVVVQQNLASLEQPLEVPILGADRAPNLVAFLNARGIHRSASTVATVDEAAAAVAAGRHSVIVAIDDAFAADFGTPRAARVTIVFDRSKSRAA